MKNINQVISSRYVSQQGFIKQGFTKQGFTKKGFTQQGFTIVEIMLAITLSLVLMAGVIQVYLSSKESFRVQNELAQVQENQRIAVEFLRRDISQAGFVPFGSTKTVTNRIAITDGGGSASDSITVSYVSNLDCLGSDTTANQNGIATNRYFIQNGQLMCQGNASAAAQPIADGVTNMQILLGSNTVFANDSLLMPSADAYVNVSSLTSMTSVVSVRIALLVRSTANVKSQAVTQNFTLLDTNVGPTDRFKRQVVTTTIPLRNV